MDENSLPRYSERLEAQTTVLALRLAEAVLALLDTAHPITGQERQKYMSSLAETAQYLAQVAAESLGPEEAEVVRAQLPRVHGGEQ